MCICGLKRTIFRNGTLKSSINTGRYTADYLQCGNLPYLAWKKRMTVHILSYRRIRRYLALSLKATEEHVTLVMWDPQLPLLEHKERSHRLISKIVISGPQEKDGTENYRRTPETVTMEIHLEPVFSHKRHKTVDIRLWASNEADRIANIRLT